MGVSGQIRIWSPVCRALEFECYATFQWPGTHDSLPGAQASINSRHSPSALGAEAEVWQTSGLLWILTQKTPGGRQSAFPKTNANGGAKGVRQIFYHRASALVWHPYWRPLELDPSTCMKGAQSRLPFTHLSPEWWAVGTLLTLQFAYYVKAGCYSSGQGRNFLTIKIVKTMWCR